MIKETHTKHSLPLMLYLYRTPRTCTQRSTSAGDIYKRLYIVSPPFSLAELNLNRRKNNEHSIPLGSNVPYSICCTGE